MTVPQARRLRDIPDSALALIEAGAIGLDNVLEDLASDPGLPAAEGEQADYDRDNCGEQFDGLS